MKNVKTYVVFLHLADKTSLLYRLQKIIAGRRQESRPLSLEIMSDRGTDVAPAYAQD